MLYHDIPVKRPNEQKLINYGTSLALLKNLTIATRYSVCRRQFANIDGTSEERKLIDYQTHMHILGPVLAIIIV